MSFIAENPLIVLVLSLALAVIVAAAGKRAIGAPSGLRFWLRFRRPLRVPASCWPVHRQRPPMWRGCRRAGGALPRVSRSTTSLRSCWSSLAWWLRASLSSRSATWRTTTHARATSRCSHSSPAR